MEQCFCERCLTICSAFNYMSCILFELGDEEEQCKVPSGSIVSEVLHCENGTLHYHLILTKDFLFRIWMSSIIKLIIFLVLIINGMQALGYYRQIYVPSIDRFCLLETMNVNEAEVQDFLLYRFNSTLENCVSNCFSYFILDICDVFSFNAKKRICSRYRSWKNLTFFNTESVDDSEFYTLVNCTEAGNAVDSFINEETEIETDFNKTKVIPLKFLREVCTIERFPFADSIKAIRITLMYPRTMEICLAQCRMSFSTVACNAFLFSLAEESCVLLHYNDVPKTQNKIRKSSSHFYKILNCEYDLNLVQSPEAPSISSYVNTKVEIVKLYAFYEICEIEKANFKTVQGVYSIDINHRIYSLNKCLHLCRREATTSKCQAVLFSQKKYFCKLLVNGLPQNFVTVKDGEELVFMIACYNDRIEERLNNPPPMNYYLEEMKKICVVEAYTLQNLSAWAVIANITDVSNIKECLSMCVKHYSMEKCTAVNFSLKNYCALIKRDASKSYTVMEKSIFVEILQCVPGLFSHQIYDI
ncbi:putative PAN domain protein [Trichinella spiralis]|uniref:putative PAN domain protein n=1 Tax=Trichinella spiralis TaxID=6334 RepID=UPI0001EFC62C|nr:putative PAN domain protein [Trichinella spiralis]